MGRLAGTRAAGLLGGQPVADGKYNVVLESEVAAQFLGVLASSLKGDNLVKGRSLLAKQQGRQALSAEMTIIDDGLYPRGLGTRAFDGEGQVQQTTPLVEAGVVMGFVFDLMWGARAGKSSTGNSVRSSLLAPPSVGFTNLYIKPGKASLADLLSEMDRGLVITEVMGVHTADPVSGEFSLGAAGHLVEGGRITRPVKSIAVAGQVVEMFNAVKTVGSDLRFHGSTGAPSLLLEGLSVSGP
jgi:PmbA protein